MLPHAATHEFTLFVLEEELLFPANTQVALFVSMDVGTFFDLDSVQILIDGKEVSNYLYTAREREALVDELGIDDGRHTRMLVSRSTTATW